jgi:DNA-binding NarL/FixJ family response regulator
MAKIKVIIAEDHAVVRQGLRVLVEEARDMEVVGEARNGQEAVKMAKQCAPDVVLMDLVMPVMGGAEATRQLLQTSPKSRVLVLSSYTAEECVWELLQAGAVGYLTKHSASEELLQAIREVHTGGSYFSPGIARNIRKQNRAAHLGRGSRGPSRLSPREAQVLGLIATGMPNKEIAYTLQISIKTVEKHRQQLIDKLDIHDTAGLTRYAVEHGYLQPAVAPGKPTALAQQQLPLAG